MTVARLRLYCQCGGAAIPCALFLTPLQTLLVEAFCIRCTNIINIQFSLPNLMGVARATQTDKDEATIDAEFLKSMHILDEPPEGG